MRDADRSCARIHSILNQITGCEHIYYFNALLCVYLFLCARVYVCVCVINVTEKPFSANKMWHKIRKESWPSTKWRKRKIVRALCAYKTKYDNDSIICHIEFLLPSSSKGFVGVALSLYFTICLLCIYLYMHAHARALFFIDIKIFINELTLHTNIYMKLIN